MEKVLFFALDIDAPWPTSFPAGRVLEEPFRHVTLAFLGNIALSKVENVLSSFPQPSFKVGPVGKFHKCLFLPEKHPRVVAWHIEWLDGEKIQAFQKDLCIWLQKNDLIVEEKTKKFLSHLTISRGRFIVKDWKEAFFPLPLMVTKIRLYESLGNSRYRSLWEYPFILPFEEIEHTADIAFIVKGENLRQLHINAQVALFFKFPELLPFIVEPDTVSSIEEVVMELNNMITKVDMEIGSPIKAISFHGEAKKDEENIYRWEMIIDV